MSKKLDQADLSTHLKSLDIDVDATNKQKEAEHDIDVVEIGQRAAHEMKSLGSNVVHGTIIDH